MSWCNVKTSLMLSQRNVDRFPPLLSIRLSVSWPLMKLTLFVSRKADDEPLCHAQLVSEAGERPKNPRASVWSQLPRTARAAQEQTVRTRNVRVFFSFTIAVYDINNLFKHCWSQTKQSCILCCHISMLVPFWSGCVVLYHQSHNNHRKCGIRLEPPHRNICSLRIKIITPI